MRFMPSLQAFRKALTGAGIGRILSVRAEVGQDLPSWRKGDYRKTVSAQKKLGGGVLLELSHEFDYLRWLFGEVSWVSAVARTQSDLAIDTEDTALMVLGLAPKKGREVIAAVALDFVRVDHTRTCTVIGDKGTLRWDALAGTVTVYKSGKWKTVFSRAPQRGESVAGEWAHFLQCIRRKTAPLISGGDGLAVLKIVEAAKESSRRGVRVKL